VEGQFYLMGVAGLGLSLAGFSSLLTVFRAPGSWDEVTLWRARTIVRASIDTASTALLPVPVWYLTGSTDWAIRAGTAMMLALLLVRSIRNSPRRFPQAWGGDYSRVPFYVITSVTAVVMVVNLVLANLGLLLLLLVLQLGFPASIFARVVEEFRPD
jgi:hypothetical protein